MRVKRLIEITLGIMTAVGGFVDISELVFASQSGARFGFALIWVFALATIGIATFGEMCGRIAAVAKQPVFNLMRQRLGLQLGLVMLVASVIVNTITCAAEIGGTALVLQLLTGWSYRLLAIISTVVLVAVIWVLPFKWIERLFGFLGLMMLVFAAATVAIRPDWTAVATGFVPQIPPGLSSKELLTFAYFAIAILSAVMFPYETYFYSSGGIEEHWGPKDLKINLLTTTVGFGLGSLLAIALLVNAAVLFRPLHIDPQLPGTVALQAAIPFGKTGLLLALAGMLFAIAGAAVETGLSTGYSVAQFFGWQWGRYQKPYDAPRFTLAWVAAFGVGLALVLCGIEPLQLVEWSIVFSVVVLPLTYLPVLLIANDRKYMREYTNGRFSNALGWVFYGILLLVAVAAVPLYLVTSGGQL
jgi:Mn2+/Fe2+ NRAMP family transporter